MSFLARYSNKNKNGQNGDKKMDRNVQSHTHVLRPFSSYKLALTMGIFTTILVTFRGIILPAGLWFFVATRRASGWSHGCWCCRFRVDVDDLALCAVKKEQTFHLVRYYLCHATNPRMQDHVMASLVSNDGHAWKHPWLCALIWIYLERNGCLNAPKKRPALMSELLCTLQATPAEKRFNL